MSEIQERLADEFRLPFRVYIEDTDAGGIVFYANYLKYFERARTELVRSLGIELRASLKNNINYVVHSIEIKYKNSAQLDDMLIATARIIKLARSYMVFRQTVVSENNRVLVEGTVKVACVELSSGKPVAIPEVLHGALESRLRNPSR